MAQGRDHARLLTTPTGLRLDTESRRTAWSLYRGFRARDAVERTLARAGVPLQVVVRGRVVSAREAGAPRATIDAFSLVQMLAGLKVAAPLHPGIEPGCFPPQWQ